MTAHAGRLYSSPFDIAGMEVVARRLVQAILNREKVLVFGDYDCDGICAAYIMSDFLNQCGARASVLFPLRQDGYGIRSEQVYRAWEEKYTLIVTVDNGISAIDAADTARLLGIDMVITDHHEPLASIPGVPVTDPKLPGSRCYREFSGAGVAYKACCAVCELLGRDYPEELLDLVSLATVVDMCPLTGENFILARQGMLKMRRSPRPGIAALLSKAGVSRITGQVMSWVLGPPINAAGRMSDPMLAYRLIAAETYTEAERLAQELDQIRKKRQEEVKKVTEVCLAQDDSRAFALFASPDWSEGIIGIAAGRLMETLMRPVAVGSICGDKVQFSARSPGEFNLIEALDECQRRKKVFLTHGGHKSAAGFSMLEKDLPVVKQTLHEIALNMLRPEDAVEWLDIDTRLDAVPTPDEVIELDLLEPHGNQNPVPTFYVKDCVVEVKTGSGWFLVRTGAGFKFFTSKPAGVGDVVHTALSLAIDEYKGTLSIIGRALDVRSFIFAREDLLERYLAWRKGKEIPKWAEVIFNELGLARTGSNEKTSLFKSPTFLKYGSIKA
ncbi:MAG TPA: hypothetical protein GXX19_13045 [Syntrophomonadaceae bacterium]|nr:hypothetical protein [Syntrophomonadaceae bacterium]